MFAKTTIVKTTTKNDTSGTLPAAVSQYFSFNWKSCSKFCFVSDTLAIAPAQRAPSQRAPAKGQARPLKPAQRGTHAAQQLNRALSARARVSTPPLSAAHMPAKRQERPLKCTRPALHARLPSGKHTRRSAGSTARTSAK